MSTTKVLIFACALFCGQALLLRGNDGDTDSDCPAIHRNDPNPLNGTGKGSNLVFHGFKPSSSYYLPRKIWVRRHCDKDGDYEVSPDCSGPLWPAARMTHGCDAKGWERGTQVGQVMTTSEEQYQIDVVMCARNCPNTVGGSYRMCELAWQIIRTARPNDWFTVPFYSFCEKSYTEVAQAALNTPANAGKNVLIVWDHGEIPDVLSALHYNGLPKHYWGSDLFSLTVTLTYPSSNALQPLVTSECDCVAVDGSTTQCDAQALAYHHPTPLGCLNISAPV